ncbi:MAG: zinc-ribbon domain-containing protein [Bacteroidales bacterium]|nr:zinc-ribbon domain-containing protein [Bacteroidales bacterium]
MKFCPFCGHELQNIVRFCENCGKEINPPVPAVSVVTETTIPAIETPVVKETVPIQQSSPVPEPFQNKEKKKSRNKLPLILGVILLIGIVWWYFEYPGNESTENLFPADSTLMIDESTSQDTAAQIEEKATINKDKPAEEVKREEEKPAKEAVKSTAKPEKSKASKEKSTAAGKGKTTSTSKEKAAPEKNKPVVVVPEPISSKAVRTVFSSGNKEFPKNKGPKNPTRFTLSKPTLISKIVTDHYNEDEGTVAAGTITILNKSKIAIGIYKATGKNGSNGTTNGKWVAEPNVLLEPGTYYIQDSEPSTWSKSFLGTGFVEIEGYENK